MIDIWGDAVKPCCRSSNHATFDCSIGHSLTNITTVLSSFCSRLWSLRYRHRNGICGVFVTALSPFWRPFLIVLWPRSRAFCRGFVAVYGRHLTDIVTVFVAFSSALCHYFNALFWSFCYKDRNRFVIFLVPFLDILLPTSRPLCRRFVAVYDRCVADIVTVFVAFSSPLCHHFDVLFWSFCHTFTTVCRCRPNTRPPQCFYRAMHVVLAQYCYRQSPVRSSVSLSVRPSVTLMYAGHIGWTSSKLITRIGTSLLGATTSAI